MGAFAILSAGGPLTGSTLAVIVASGAGVLLLIATVILVYSRRRQQQQQQRREPFDLSLDDIHNGGLSVKSEPSSRTPSPRQVKRLSCPDALAGLPGRDLPAVAAAAAAGSCPDLPDFNSLPRERVQPRGSFDAGVHVIPRLPQGGGDVHTTSGTLHCQNDPAGGGNFPSALSSSGTEEEEVCLPRSAHGRLWYSLVYDGTQEMLTVTLIKVNDLPGRGSHNQLRDPYVKVYVLPDERTCHTSKVRKKTLSPVYNDTFHFQVSARELTERTLRFSVYDVDKRKVRHSLGHVMVPLRDVSLDLSDACWSDLETNTQISSSQLGDLQLGLCYQPQNEKLKVSVFKARGFKSSFHRDHQVRLHVRLQLYYGRKLNRTKYTAPRENQREGETEGGEVDFNEALSFSLAGKQLESCRLEATFLMATPPYRTATDVEDCGRVVLGPFMYARGEQLQHWQHVLAQPRVTVTRWHALSAPPVSHHH